MTDTIHAEPKRILFVQMGDYRDAYQRLRDGLPETYRDQKRSVEFVASLANRAETTTLSLTDADYETVLGPHLHACGMKRDTLSRQAIDGFFDRYRPSHVILRTPHPEFLRAARRSGACVLPTFADIFKSGGVKSFFRNRKIRSALRGAQAVCYSNHSLNASLSMAECLKLPPQQIVPWDWAEVPLAGPGKPSIKDVTAPRIMYAGVLSEAKGVGDLIHAVAQLAGMNIKAHLSIAGPGDPAPFADSARQLGVAGQVRFIGLLPNTEVRAQMHAHDIVVVPSRASYPEGLPNTIYEGLASRSALVISDHPAFSSRFTSGEDAIVFENANPEALVRGIRRLLEEDGVYQRISHNAEAALANLYVGLEWTELVTLFLDDPYNKSGWVEKNALTHLVQ